MPLKDFYERFSDDRRLLFVRMIFGIFFTGLITLGWSFYRDIKNSQKYDQMVVQRDSLKDDLESSKRDIIVLKAQVQNLIESQYRFNFLEDQFAMPRLLKSTDGLAFAVNNAFYKDFMEPFGFEKTDYQGKTDVEFWGKAIAKEFRKREKMVIDLDRPVTFQVSFENPFKKGEIIDRKVTIAPLKDRYGRIIALEKTINKDYK